MKHALLYLSFIALACQGLHAADAPSRQVVLLKLDDVIARPHPGKIPVSDRWQRIADHLAANHIKGSFGVICESLEQDNPAYFQWIRDIQKAGLIEIWMHGYHMKKAIERGEFDHGTVEEQKAILEKSERLAKEKLGFSLPVFGPHWTTTTDATDQALKQVPDIKIWLYGPQKPKFFTRLSIERVMALENSTFHPDPEKFKETYEKIGAQREVLLLQGHPDQWDDKRWEGFVQIVEFLKSKDVVFMTHSEYAATLTGK